MPKILPALLAEAIGVFALSFVGILAIHHLGGQPSGLIGIALAHGLILAVMISAFAAISGGHINPAVTIGLLVGGKIKAGSAAAYIVAQVIGGVCAGIAILAIFPRDEAIKVIVGGTPAAAERSGATTAAGGVCGDDRDVFSGDCSLGDGGRSTGPQDRRLWHRKPRWRRISWQSGRSPGRR